MYEKTPEQLLETNLSKLDSELNSSLETIKHTVNSKKKLNLHLLNRENCLLDGGIYENNKIIGSITYSFNGKTILLKDIVFKKENRRQGNGYEIVKKFIEYALGKAGTLIIFDIQRENNGYNCVNFKKTIEAWDGLVNKLYEDGLIMAHNKGINKYDEKFTELFPC